MLKLLDSHQTDALFYAGTGSINTSDETLKTIDILNAERDAAIEINHSSINLNLMTQLITKELSRPGIILALALKP
ncbi:hypothetical protein [Escherichia coli]|uniref:hypothetical protein n=1 Tax=Escherichia coli TaxID=562 RepID=UPI001FD92F11|nr:hypothetical protein [Escherichia coli]